jgi:predicted transcriptional regulator
MVPTETDKQRALEAIRALPDGATIDDAIERLCFIAKIEEGLQQSHAGKVTSHEEVKKRARCDHPVDRPRASRSCSHPRVC